MGCNASKAFVPEYHPPSRSQHHGGANGEQPPKQGIISGDSFVGWLFGMPPSNRQDSGYTSGGSTSGSGGALQSKKIAAAAAAAPVAIDGFAPAPYLGKHDPPQAAAVSLVPIPPSSQQRQHTEQSYSPASNYNQTAATHRITR